MLSKVKFSLCLDGLADNMYVYSVYTILQKVKRLRNRLQGKG